MNKMDTIPLEWFEEKYCSVCEEKRCIKKSITIYPLSTDYNGKIFCVLSALLMNDIGNLR